MFIWLGVRLYWAPCGLAGKESACNAGDLGLIPGLGGSPGEGNGYPLQYSGLENSTEYTYTVGGRKESDTTERLSLSLMACRISVSAPWIKSMLPAGSPGKSQNSPSLINGGGEAGQRQWQGVTWVGPQGVFAKGRSSLSCTLA